MPDQGPGGAPRRQQDLAPAGYVKLARVIEGVQFTDGIQADETETRAAA